MDKIKFTKLNILAAVILVAALGAVWGAGCSADSNCPNLNTLQIMDWVFNRYQTLMTGCIALFVGWLAFEGIKYQANVAERARGAEYLDKYATITMIIVHSSVNDFLEPLKDALFSIGRSLVVTQENRLEGLANLPPREPAFYRNASFYSLLKVEDLEIVWNIENQIESFINLYRTIRSNQQFPTQNRCLDEAELINDTMTAILRMGNDFSDGRNY